MPTSTRAERLDLFRDILAKAQTRDEKTLLTQLFNRLQHEFGKHDEEIQRLRDELAEEKAKRLALESAIAPSRPDTGSTALGERTTFYAAAAATTSNNPPGNYPKFTKITPEHAIAIINRQCDAHNQLGCMLSSNRAGHPNGYIKINLTHTKGSDGEQLGFQPWLHQIALIASNRLLQLQFTGGRGGYETSHLCHEGGCFNPDHLVVETAQANKARNSCHGHWIVKHGGMTWDPCVHGEDGVRKKCILPVKVLDDGYHCNHS